MQWVEPGKPGNEKMFRCLPVIDVRRREDKSTDRPKQLNCSGAVLVEQSEQPIKRLLAPTSEENRSAGRACIQALVVPDDHGEGSKTPQEVDREVFMLFLAEHPSPEFLYSTGPPTT